MTSTDAIYIDGKWFYGDVHLQRKRKKWRWQKYLISSLGQWLYIHALKYIEMYVQGPVEVTQRLETTAAFAEDSRLFPAPTPCFTTACNSSSRRGTISGLSRLLNKCGSHKPMQTQHIQIKIIHLQNCVFTISLITFQLYSVVNLKACICIFLSHGASIN